MIKKTLMTVFSALALTATAGAQPPVSGDTLIESGDILISPGARAAPETLRDPFSPRPAADRED
jgi:hypothetical protein